MLSYSGTGVVTTGEQKVTKAISALIISSTKTPEQFTTENITIWIERPNRDNVVIATSIPLVSYLILTNYNAEALQSDATNATIALCELSDEESGAVMLQDGDSLKYRIDGLVTTSTYSVYTLEDAEVGTDFYAFERKTFAAEDVTRTQNVERAELGVFNLHSSITQVSLKYMNGITVKYLPFEIRAISRDLDPVFSISNAGVVAQGHTSLVCMPLVGVSEIEVVKTAGTLIELITMTSKNLNEV